ncbi:hypothetical protein M409DRAFT_28758 [Zasmidium cellare ATCC 36951]|uniref:Uncharacterized protein n=1 Tax=Zasmidium cellare ATCC 36951 TaxID=1080233 RepID=A0A6A6C3L2_ZASCE|nr:uncharacterized protein M409DRAFT_28758 [Zasmidium cellare ATCC 36951]KAF2160878.1 hypothetical protein M409DRAFT_28758 [Zasmidium cellare ATCC 36951]
MDGRNYYHNPPTAMSSSSFFDFDFDSSFHSDEDAHEQGIPTATSTTMTPTNQAETYQSPHLAPTPRYSSNLAPTFERNSYPAPSVVYNNPYPARLMPTYQPPNFQPRPPPTPMASVPTMRRSPYPTQFSFTPPPPSMPIDPALLTLSDAHFEPLLPGNELPAGPQLLEGLFGNALPQFAAVSGTAQAVNQLRKAIDFEHLMVESNVQGFQEAFVASLKHLQVTGAIADPEMVDTGRGRFTLDEMTWYERGAFGITPADFLIDPAESVQNFGSPPFKGKVDFLLGFLRVMEKYHDHSHGTSYQLGIVSKTIFDEFTVQIFQTKEGAEAAHTVWLFRECIGDYSSPDGWTESWRAFVERQGTQDTGQTSSSSVSDTFLFPKQHQNFDRSGPSYRNTSIGALSPPKRKQRGRPRKTASLPSFPTTAPSAHDIPPRHNWSGAQTKQDNAHHFQHLTDEEILSGSVHPDDIVGTLMLRLVPAHSNSELHERINALYARVDPDEPKNVTASSITKRWTLALQHICKRDGLDRKAEMDRYHRMRSSNGIPGGTGGGEGPPASKKRKASRMKGEEEEKAVVKREESPDADAKFEEDDDFVTPPARPPTCRRRMRKQVNYATALENFEGLEDDDEQDGDSRPAKRKKYAEEDDEGSEFEQ